jgi:exonuclease VII small subunit
MNEGMENLKEIEELEEDKRRLNKIVDTLEQRIAKLEKVLASHAKCIGQLREDKNDQTRNS